MRALTFDPTDSGRTSIDIIEKSESGRVDDKKQQPGLMIVISDAR